MSAALSEAPVTADTEWRRLSPRMLLVHPIIELGRFVPALVGLFLAGGGNDHGLYTSAVGAVVVVGFGLLRWVTTTFRITPEQVQLRRGLLRRTTVVAPLDRVRTVDVTAHLLHRLLELAKVEVGTGTSDRKGHDGLVLDGLSADAAGRLRAELLHRDPQPGTSDPADPAAPAAPAEQEIVALKRAWVRYGPFTLTGAITGLAVVGFGWRIGNEAQVDLGRFGPLRAVAELLRHTSLAVDIVAVMVAVLVFVAVASTIGYVLAFWDFRLTRHTGGTLHVTRGLFTARATSIERRRLLGAEISEALLLRSVGAARCLAIATGLRGGPNAERGNGLLLPPAPRAEAIRVAADVLGTGAPFAVPLREHGSAARRRRLVRAGAGSLGLVALLAVTSLLTASGSYLWIAAPVLLVGAAPLGLDRYRNLGHALTDGYVVASFGSLVRRRSALACDGVIGWNFTSTFFQRRAGLTTLTATTAAGKQGYAVYDIAEPEAVGFAEAAVPGLVAQFLRPS